MLWMLICFTNLSIFTLARFSIDPVTCEGQKSQQVVDAIRDTIDLTYTSAVALENSSSDSHWSNRPEVRRLWVALFGSTLRWAPYIKSEANLQLYLPSRHNSFLII